MKKGMRIVALILALAMVLSASAAFADAYTVPKDLKKVEGLPENPEVPTMKTKNDGHTETVTVIGDVASLAANWNNELVPLELVDGVAVFSIDGHIVQLGMAAKHSSWTGYGYEHEEYYAPLDMWVYRPIAKDGYDSEVTLPASTEIKYSGSDWGYVEYRNPYVESTKPGYRYWVPYEIYEPEDDDDDDDDDDDEEEMSEEEQAKWDEYYKVEEEFWKKYYENYNLPGRFGDLIEGLEPGDYDQYSHELYYETLKRVESMKRDGAKEAAIKQELDNAFAALGTTEFENWFGNYDTTGEVRVLEIRKHTNFWASDIKFYGDAFQAELPDGKTLVHYNRKGEACEKEIVVDGADFFESEKAPTKVVVIYSSGKNMYNKTVWYISKIQQVYDDITVTATFSQNGKVQKGGIKETATAK